MSVDVDLLFKGMKDAPMGRPKTYMGIGRYLVELKELFVKKSDKDGTPVFVCRFKVLESSNESHPPGSDGSWTLSGAALSFGQGDVKALMMAILGIDPRKVAKDDNSHALASLLFRWLLGSESAKAEVAALPEKVRPEANFYLGKRLRLETRENEKKTFTKHFWSAE